jgi:2-keto-3-deoxy-L-rhamnonate aldolase RhmA
MLPGDTIGATYNDFRKQRKRGKAMRENRMKRMIQEGKPVVGFGLSTTDTFVAEIVGKLGFDFILIDFQHAPLTVKQFQDLMIALSPTESTVIARAPWNNFVWINHMLDVGAEGIILPWVNTAEQAAMGADAIKYPPAGHRSWGPRRAGPLYASNMDEYAVQANDNTLFLPQIETAEAVENLDAILSVDGVDGIMIGPNDLAFSLGYVENRDNADVEATIQKVLDGCKANGKAFGMFTPNLESAKMWIRRGGLIATGVADVRLIAEGAAQALNEIKALQQEIG